MSSEPIAGANDPVVHPLLLHALPSSAIDHLSAPSAATLPADAEGSVTKNGPDPRTLQIRPEKQITLGDLLKEFYAVKPQPYDDVSLVSDVDIEEERRRCLANEHMRRLAAASVRSYSDVRADELSLHQHALQQELPRILSQLLICLQQSGRPLTLPARASLRGIGALEIYSLDDGRTRIELRGARPTAPVPAPAVTRPKPAPDLGRRRRQLVLRNDSHEVDHNHDAQSAGQPAADAGQPAAE